MQAVLSGAWLMLLTAAWGYRVLAHAGVRNNLAGHRASRGDTAVTRDAF